MGTPDFAVPSLQALHESRHDIVLVVTQPDRPRGRGRKIMPSPVKESAIRYGYDLSQPESVKSDTFRDVIAGFKPDLLVVVAFGRILPGRLLELPSLQRPSMFTHHCYPDTGARLPFNGQLSTEKKKPALQP